MDCRTPEGKVILCYASELVLGHIKLRQSSLLINSADKGAQTRQSFFRGVLPIEKNGIWHWKCPALGVIAQWKLDGVPATALNLYEPEAGKKVVWHCLAPRANVQIALNGSQETGIGYVECLSLTLEPWKIPMDTLHWGRFHGDDGEAMTWIIWEGSHPLSFLLKGGTLLSPESLPANDGTSIQFKHETHTESLKFSKERILRTGDISRTALKYFPNSIKRLLPENILHLHETKWASRALLSNGEQQQEGFAIHEIVHFLPSCPSYLL